MKQLMIVLAAIALVSCGGPSGDDPKAVAQSFMDKLSELDFEGAAELATEEGAASLLMISGFMAQMPEDQMAEMDQGTGQATVTDVSIDGDTAVATFVATDADGMESTETLNLVKENGSWKVAFEKDAMEM